MATRGRKPLTTCGECGQIVPYQPYEVHLVLHDSETGKPIDSHLLAKTSSRKQGMHLLTTAVGQYKQVIDKASDEVKSMDSIVRKNDSRNRKGRGRAEKTEFTK